MAHDQRNLESARHLVRFQRGDPEAFSNLVSLWERPLYFYIRRMVRTEADAWEVLQETWLRLFQSIARVRDPHVVSTYFYTVARSAVLRKLQRRDWADAGGDGALVIDLKGIDDVRAFDNAEAVRAAIDQLPWAQREVITLFFLQDLSLAEIALVLQIPVGTVKSRLHYGKQALRSILSEG